MIQCDKEGCHKEAVVLVPRLRGDVFMCWDEYQDYLETENDQMDYGEYQLTNR